MDIWRSAIVRQPAADIEARGVDRDAVIWLPEMPEFSFRADPFGLWRDGRLHVFAEAFDYRTRVGRIDALIYDGGLNLLESGVALREPWHLSYPFVFQAEGETWMLPEAYKSGTLTLYRARSFPFEWQAACRIPLDTPAIDATPFFHDGKWWLFYAPSQPPQARRSHLHLAWAKHPAGPWRPHPGNPVRVDPGSTRPGGTPRAENGMIFLPVQDCRATYGGALRRLVITRLDERGFEASDQPLLTPPAWMAPFNAGLHTMAAAGPVTLIDAKRLDNSLRGAAIRLGGIARRWARTGGGLTKPPWRVEAISAAGGDL